MSSQRTYSSAQKRFINFCTEHGFLNGNGSPCPAPEIVILRFIAFLSDTCKASSIKVYLAAVRSLHINEGFQDPLLGCLRIPLVVRGLRRRKQDFPKEKLPITPSILLSIKAELDLSKLQDIWFWAVC